LLKRRLYGVSLLYLIVCLFSQVNIGADHRVLDGATVARFCNEWKQLIEKPELLMLLMR
jgi:pyruvate/2-oxoglutarate dehydrogenase complex dihydrolipoamide acyltransferase (E2) component